MSSGKHKKKCCCNCSFYLELFKHPMNKVYSGNMSEPTGLFCCTVFHYMDGVNRAIIFDCDHGQCEMWSVIKK